MPAEKQIVESFEKLASEVRAASNLAIVRVAVNKHIALFS
jgi:hypothetical protein